MTANYHERNHWVGTAAEMALCIPINPGAVWFQTDTLDSYWWDGLVWQGMGGGGGALADHDHSGDVGDGGQFDADNLLSTGANDGDVLTSDGAGNSAWEPGGGGAPLALDDLTDVNAPAPNDDDVLTWDALAGEWIAAVGGGGALVDHVHSAAAGEGGLLDWDTIWSDAVHSHSAAGEGGTLDWDNIWSDAVHDHSAAGEGGTLDWDSVWSDAVHDHSSAAEGGAVDASVVTYDPAVDADWDGGVDPGDTNDALDQLAERTADLEANAFVRQTIFTYSGNIAVGGGLLRIYNLTGVTQVVTQVFICVTTAPTGANLIVDIHRDGVTIFTNQANRPEIVAAGFTDSTLVIDLPNWLDGEYLTAHIDAIGTTITGANLTIHVVHHS